MPPTDWRPDPSWPPAPEGWSFLVDDTRSTTEMAGSAPVERTYKLSLRLWLALGAAVAVVGLLVSTVGLLNAGPNVNRSGTAFAIGYEFGSSSGIATQADYVDHCASVISSQTLVDPAFDGFSGTVGCIEGAAQSAGDDPDLMVESWLSTP